MTAVGKMKRELRRVLRRAAGVDAVAPVPSADEVADLRRRLEAMDKGLQEMILATRAENDRELAKVRAEIDVVVGLVDQPSGQEPTRPTARPSSDS